MENNKSGKIKNKGITLISLVVTVTVILILTSIGIYSGVQTVNMSKFMAFETELKIMQTEVNKLYDNYKYNETIDIDGITYYGEKEKGNTDNKLTILVLGSR